MKLRKEVKIFLVVLVIVIIGSIFISKKIEEYRYKQTYEYKLLQIDYSKSDIKILLKKLKDKELNILLKKTYNENYITFIKEKYFIFKNIDEYIEYQEENDKLESSKIVALVNVGAYRDFYEDPVATDVSKGDLILVNKYNYIDKDYVTEDIEDISSQYAYEGNSIKSNVYSAYKSMWNAAKADGIQLIVVSSYRTYDYQEKLWKDREEFAGEESADAYTARAGYSEHQTGLAIDLSMWGDTANKFADTPAFIWMQEHATEYGFILRYPLDKENITGYEYEAWHYRYVGTDMAKKIEKEGITFDEYYAYYIAKK